MLAFSQSIPCSVVSRSYDFRKVESERYSIITYIALLGSEVGILCRAVCDYIVTSEPDASEGKLC